MQASVSQNTEFNPPWEVGLVDVDEAVEEKNPGRAANFPFQLSVPPALCRPPAIQIPVLRKDVLPMHAAHLVRNHVPFVQGTLGPPIRRWVPPLIGLVAGTLAWSGKSPRSNRSVPLRCTGLT